MTYDGIVVDYGHGGMIDGKYQTAGKQYCFTDHEDYWIGEGITNRKTAAFLIKLALRSGIRVWDCVKKCEWTRDPEWTELEQTDPSLGSRVTYANEGERRKAIYLSLHSNAIGSSSTGPSLSARGVVMYTSEGQTSADPIAESITEAFKKHVAPDVPVRRGDRADGDQDAEAQFYVLRKTVAPAVLGEVGFFTNINDARFLDSEQGQRRIARAYLDGIRPFVQD